MADNFENIPVDITAEQLEERVKKPIDSKATSGSTYLITSGAVYNVKKELNKVIAEVKVHVNDEVSEIRDYIDDEVSEAKDYVDESVADKVVLVEATVRTYADLDSLFNNSAYDVNKAIFNLTISGLGEIRPIVGGSNFIGTISNDILLMTNKETADTWIYAKGSNNVEKKEYLPDVTFVEYDGKYTVSTFAELDEILNEKQYLSVMYAFTFPENSEIYNVVKGVNFIATHGLFTDTDSGKVWTYADGTFTTKNTITKNLVVSKTEDLNSKFDGNVDFLNVSFVGGFSNIPNGQYHCSRVSFSNGINGYRLTSVTDGNSYIYNRETEAFKKLSIDVVVDQTYNPESENAQSGKAVAEALLKGIPHLKFNTRKELENYNFESDKIYVFNFGEGLASLHGLFDTFIGQAFTSWLGDTIERKYLKLLNFYSLKLETFTYYPYEKHEEIMSLQPDDELSLESENAVQNEVVTAALNDKLGGAYIKNPINTWDDLRTAIGSDNRRVFVLRFGGELLEESGISQDFHMGFYVSIIDGQQPYIECLDKNIVYRFYYVAEKIGKIDFLTVDSDLDIFSENPVKNNVVAMAVNELNSAVDSIRTANSSGNFLGTFTTIAELQDRLGAFPKNSVISFQADGDLGYASDFGIMRGRIENYKLYFRVDTKYTDRYYAVSLIYGEPAEIETHMFVDTQFSESSHFPVQNKVITSAINNINSQLGDIDTALDSIISLQEGYIGGEE